MRIDLRNAYNEIKRARVLRRLTAFEVLQDLLPLFMSTYAPKSRISLAAPGLPDADFFSEEGVQQGDAMAGVAFCGGIHPEVCALDSSLRQHGGAARFQMDDGYAIGPAEVQ